MSIVTHILICDPEEVGEPTDSADWASDVPRLDYNGVDNVLLATLWRTLDPEESGAALEGMDLVVWPEANPLVFRLPDDLARRLSLLRADEISPTATRWSEDPDAQLEGLTPDVAEKGLNELSQFAKRAATERRPLVLAIYIP